MHQAHGLPLCLLQQPCQHGLEHLLLLPLGRQVERRIALRERQRAQRGK